ncbi:MAG: DUF1127 domain-containing protein [Magnetovibrio sp.]|nr:DUF1127 domain-containing protein [Magnetovibrio sp.]
MDRYNCTNTISGTSLSSALPLSWHGWLDDGKRLLIAEVKRTMYTLKQWSQRTRARRQLAKLDEHLLRDIGLTKRQVRQETSKAFWEL